MKKIIPIFTVWSILVVGCYADMTKEQMDTYWESSRAQEMFLYGKQDLKRQLFQVVQIKKEDAKPVLLNAIDTFVNNPKYLKEYKDTFFSIDDSVYTDLNKFYNTTIGKKYRKLFTSLEDSIATREDIKVKYSELVKNHAISKEKMKLILAIDKELNLVEIKIDFTRKFTTFKQQVLYPENNVSDEMIDKAMLKYRSIAEKYETILMPVLFNDFTLDELQEILKYASSKILAIEVEYIYKASLQVSILSYTDLKVNMLELVNIRLCQDYTKSSSYIPSSCKKEWISK